MSTLDPKSADRPSPLTPLSADKLRWRCDPSVFEFKSTADVQPVQGVIGQDPAVEALHFGLACRAPEQNIIVRGLSGTGRMTLVRRLLGEIKPACPIAPDRVYVHNFQDPIRPKLISFPRGQAVVFERMVDRLIEFIANDLPAALASEAMNDRLKALARVTDEKIKQLTDPLEAKLAEQDLALVLVKTGQSIHPAIFPRVEGKPVPPEAFELMASKGEIPQELFEQTIGKLIDNREAVDQLASKIHEMRQQNAEQSRNMVEGEVRVLLGPLLQTIKQQFDIAEVRSFLDDILTDLIERRLAHLADDRQFVDKYRVNVVLQHRQAEDCPVVVENVPSLVNLLGGIQRRLVDETLLPPDHLSIRCGSILQADGGYLILEARDVLSEPAAWHALIRTLRTRKLEIVPADMSWSNLGGQFKPEPIEVSIKVILLGDSGLFDALGALDADFGNLFKVVAEFNTVIPRNEEGLKHYAEVIKRIANDDDLPDFSREAVAALVEHGSRIAARRDKLTARFSRIADVAREAGFLANNQDRTVVSAEDVVETVARTKRRANLSSIRFRELIADRLIQIDTTGAEVGQVNGLAVKHDGPLTYGFPARITASVGPGVNGVENIERESDLSGAIHTKGFYILAGLLRNLLQADFPLTFDGAVAFEQSYGGIDGDSASAAEICCLMSALTGVPIRQDLAITGSIDQLGHVQAIGGANEKIEGFFEVCSDAGLTGTQGVIIPQANVGDLMLRLDVVQAAAEGKFSIFSVSTIGQAMELLMGRALDDGTENCLVEIARKRTREYWQTTSTWRSDAPR